MTTNKPLASRLAHHAETVFVLVLCSPLLAAALVSVVLMGPPFVVVAIANVVFIRPMDRLKRIDHDVGEAVESFLEPALAGLGALLVLAGYAGLFVGVQWLQAVVADLWILVRHGVA